MALGLCDLLLLSGCDKILHAQVQVDQPHLIVTARQNYESFLSWYINSAKSHCGPRNLIISEQIRPRIYSRKDMERSVPRYALPRLVSCLRCPSLIGCPRTFSSLCHLRRPKHPSCNVRIRNCRQAGPTHGQPDNPLTTIGPWTISRVSSCSLVTQSMSHCPLDHDRRRIRYHRSVRRAALLYDQVVVVRATQLLV